MKGDRNNSKRSRKTKISLFLSSFKFSFFNYGKLVVIGLVFSLFLTGASYLYKDNKIENGTVVALSDSADAYYDRLDEVRDEYRNEEKDFR